MYAAFYEDYPDLTLIGIFSDLKQVKDFSRKRCGRIRADDKHFIYWVGVNKKCNLKNEYLVGWYERDHNKKIVWEDNPSFCDNLCKADSVDQLAESLMSRDPIVMDMARDILGVQDL